MHSKQRLFSKGTIASYNSHNIIKSYSNSHNIEFKKKKSKTKTYFNFCKSRVDVSKYSQHWI